MKAFKIDLSNGDSLYLAPKDFFREATITHGSYGISVIADTGEFKMIFADNSTVSPAILSIVPLEVYQLPTLD